MWYRRNARELALQALFYFDLNKEENPWELFELFCLDFEEMINGKRLNFDEMTSYDNVVSRKIPNKVVGEDKSLECKRDKSLECKRDKSLECERDKSLECERDKSLDSQEISNQDISNQDIPSEDQKSFFINLVEGVINNKDEIDALILESSKNWRISRMPVTDRNIMRIALYELLYCPDIPANVSINEAIEIGKKYGIKDSGSFVNGILDRVKKLKNIE